MEFIVYESFIRIRKKNIEDEFLVNVANLIIRSGAEISTLKPPLRLDKGNENYGETIIID